jgi:hypothetical protein
MMGLGDGCNDNKYVVLSVNCMDFLVGTALYTLSISDIMSKNVHGDGGVAPTKTRRAKPLLVSLCICIPG